MGELAGTANGGDKLTESLSAVEIWTESLRTLLVSSGRAVGTLIEIWKRSRSIQMSAWNSSSKITVRGRLGSGLSCESVRKYHYNSKELSSCVLGVIPSCTGSYPLLYGKLSLFLSFLLLYQELSPHEVKESYVPSSFLRPIYISWFELLLTDFNMALPSTLYMNTTGILTSSTPSPDIWKNCEVALDEPSALSDQSKYIINQDTVRQDYCCLDTEFL